MADDRKAMDKLQNKVESKQLDDERNARNRPKTKNVATWRTEKPPVMNTESDEEDLSQKKKINKSFFAVMALGVVFGGVLIMIFNQDRMASAYEYITGDHSWQRAHHAEEKMYQLGDGNRVQASLTIEVEERGQLRELSNRDVVVQRVIQNAFTTVTASEIRTNEGKDHVVEEISRTINREMDDVEVQDVYFRSILAP